MWGCHRICKMVGTGNPMGPRSKPLLLLCLWASPSSSRRPGGISWERVRKSKILDTEIKVRSNVVVLSDDTVQQDAEMCCCSLGSSACKATLRLTFLRANVRTLFYVDLISCQEHPAWHWRGWLEIHVWCLCLENSMIDRRSPSFISIIAWGALYQVLRFCGVPRLCSYGRMPSEGESMCRWRTRVCWSHICACKKTLARSQTLARRPLHIFVNQTCHSISQ